MFSRENSVSTLSGLMLHSSQSQRGIGESSTNLSIGTHPLFLAHPSLITAVARNQSAGITVICSPLVSF